MDCSFCSVSPAADQFLVPRASHLDVLPSLPLVRALHRDDPLVVLVRLHRPDIIELALYLEDKDLKVVRVRENVIIK